MDASINTDAGLSVSFIKPDMHLWDKLFLENSINSLKNFQSGGDKIANERCFTEFLLEMEQSYRVFLKKINDLPMIMKCRVKGDNKAHFGGQECAELVVSLRASAEKYLKSTCFKETGTNNGNKSPYATAIGGLHIENGHCSVHDFVSIVKNMAKEDEKNAKEIEAKVYQEYVSCGKDYTLVALKKAGYTFDSNKI